MQQLEKSWIPTTTEMQAVSISRISVTYEEGEGCKLMTRHEEEGSCPTCEGLHPQNGFTALGAEEDSDVS